MKTSSRKLLLLTFTTLYCTDSALVSTNSDRIWARLAWIVIIIMAIRYVPKSFPKITHNVGLLIGALTIGITSSMLVHEFIGVNYIQRIIIIWLAYSISIIFDRQVVIDCYIRVMRFIAVFSLVCFVLTPIILNLPFPIMASGDALFKNLIFTNVSTTIFRNYGPFWEPGAFQIYLNLALFFILRDRSKFRITDIVIFTLCVISTLSTTGILVLALVFLYYVCGSDNNKKAVAIFSRLFIILIAVVGIVVLYQFADFADTFFFKLTALSENTEDINSSNVSSYTRMYSVLSSIAAIQEYPFFGAGIEGFRDFCENKFYITSNTNTLLATPATYGILTGVFYLLLFVKSVYEKKQGVMRIVIKFLIFVIIFSMENLMVSMPIWILLFYGLNKKEEKLKDQGDGHIYYKRQN